METLDLNLLLLCITVLAISSYLPMQIAGMSRQKKFKKK